MFTTSELPPPLARMATFEEIFGSSSIEVVVPPASLEFPASGEDVDEWHRLLSKEHPERDTAFFGEVHHALLQASKIYNAN